MSHTLTDKSLVRWESLNCVTLARSTAFAEPGVAPNYGPDRTCRIHHLGLALTIDPVAHTLQGEATLDIDALPGFDTVALDLDELEVMAVTLNGASAEFTHRDGKLRIRGCQGRCTIAVTYQGSPRRGLYFTGPTPAEPDRQHMAWTQCQDEDGHFVFPCIDHPSVKCPMTIAVTAPEGYTVVGNGRLAQREGNTWTWEQEKPHPAYLVTVVVAKLTTVDDSSGDTSVRYLVPEGIDDETIRRVFHKTPRMIAHFSAIYGDYPWPRYDQVVVHDFVFGGMENTAATTLTDLVITDERAAVDWDAEDLIAHELAHQWFGDLVTCQDWSQGWLNEGWATYSETIWKTEDLGQDEADYHLFSQMGSYLDEDGSRYRRPIVSYLFRNPIDVFDAHLYEKGALVLHTLRNELGDEVFWPAVRGYLQRHAYDTTHTRHFQRAMEDATGRNLDRFFHDWIFGAGHPALKVEIEHSRDLLQVSVTQTQEGDGVADAFAFTLPLLIVDDHGERTVRLPITERSRTWALPQSGEPRRVEVDPAFSALATVELKAPLPWLRDALKHSVGAIGRIRSARALAAKGTSAAEAALAEAVGSDDFWGVRSEIAAALASIGTQAAREALLARLDEPHPKVRRAIVKALGTLRHSDTESALAAIARTGDPSIFVEGEAARSLAVMRSEQAYDVCSELLGRDSWGEFLRARALEGLSRTRRVDALPILLEWTSADRMQRARCAAISGLGRLADEVPQARGPAIERLSDLAIDSPFRVRLAAIAALGLTRDSRAMPALQRVHRADPDGRVQRQAYEAIRKVSAGRTSDDGLRAVHDGMEKLREDNARLRARLNKLEAASES